MAKISYILLPTAKRDIREIVRYISRDTPPAASKLRANILKAIHQLAEHPGIGQTHHQWTKKPVRFWPVHPNYTIIYSIEVSHIEIIRVYHSARDIEHIVH